MKLKGLKAADLVLLKQMLPASQMDAVNYAVADARRQGETSDLEEVMPGVVAMLRRCPALYTQDNVADPMVYLHYFSSGSDWLVTEANPEKRMLFGFAVLNGDTYFGELGYASVEQFDLTMVNLDFWWKPIPLSAAKHKLWPSAFPPPAVETEKASEETMNEENDKFAALKAAIEELTGETMPPGIERTLRSYESPTAGTMATVLSGMFSQVQFEEWDDLCAGNAYFTPPAATEKTADAWYKEMLDALSLRGAPGVCEFSDILVADPNNDDLAEAFDRLEQEVPDWESRTQQSVVLTPGRSGRLITVWESDAVAPPVAADKTAQAYRNDSGVKTAVLNPQPAQVEPQAEVAPAHDKARKTRHKRVGNDDTLAAIMARLDAVEAENAALKKRLESAGSPESPKRVSKYMRELHEALNAASYCGYILRNNGKKSDEVWRRTEFAAVESEYGDMDDHELSAEADKLTRNALALADKCDEKRLILYASKWRNWIASHRAKQAA